MPSLRFILVRNPSTHAHTCVHFHLAHLYTCTCAGFFFLFLSGIIAWRVVTFSQAANRSALLALAATMGLAGLICIFYQRHWFFSMNAAVRVPIYTILGISLSFALTFAIAELMNYAAWHAVSFTSGPAPRAQSALVQSPTQIFLLAATSVALGCTYGIIFGVTELGKNVFTLHTLRVRPHHTRTHPVRTVCGHVYILYEVVMGVNFADTIPA